ncbi:hypothetical protein RQ734_02790 [Roseomonas mucosa]|uniref:hypothetical protein n=1 Tax=Roseomonas mucosa TaxID=207340 RepID=UPI00208F66FE|nr:hypothetical protein [Roseomonas mucosa]MDT8274970.1 hypothetical protein [Roseomonas mucosa]USQ70694.1 hypothetical protein NF552_14360 [Roseomonas mucosa]
MSQAVAAGDAAAIRDAMPSAVAEVCDLAREAAERAALAEAVAQTLRRAIAALAGRP